MGTLRVDLAPRKALKRPVGTFTSVFGRVAAGPRRHCPRLSGREGLHYVLMPHVAVLAAGRSAQQHPRTAARP